MVSRDFQTLADRRAVRARRLAERYPASREALLFVAEIAVLQQRLDASLASPPPPASGGVDFSSLLPGRRLLTDFIEMHGPQRLRDEAARYGDAECVESLEAYVAGRDTTSPRSLLARVLLQPVMHARRISGNDRHATLDSLAPAGGDGRCPSCGHLAQAGCLRPHGDGAALSLVCSLCLGEWPFSRLRCAGCGESGHHKISFYSTAEFAHLEVQACESCGGYLHLVNAGKEAEAVPDVDELAALPLDVWAREKGYVKLQPNLAGI